MSAYPSYFLRAGGERGVRYRVYLPGMARREIILTIDDIDGVEGATTIEFSLDGFDYAIDLRPENEKALRDALAPFVGAARRTGGRKKRGLKVA